MNECNFIFTEVSLSTGSWERDFIKEPIVEINESLHQVRIRKQSKTYKYLDKKYDLQGNDVVIRKISNLEKILSYKLHTNRELSLMLCGRKPLSVFSRHIKERFDIFNGQKFNKFKDNIFTKIINKNDMIYNIKYIPGEEWRVDAYKCLINIRSYFRNSPELEIFEGELLGYSSEENLEFVNKLFSLR